MTSPRRFPGSRVSQFAIVTGGLSVAAIRDLYLSETEMIGAFIQSFWAFFS